MGVIFTSNKKSSHFRSESNVTSDLTYVEVSARYFMKKWIFFGKKIKNIQRKGTTSHDVCSRVSYWYHENKTDDTNSWDEHIEIYIENGGVKYDGISHILSEVYKKQKESVKYPR